jgi:hypothetical protein
MGEIVRICYGLALVTSGEITWEGHRWVNLRLTENSYFPGQEVRMYPVDLIEERHCE